MLKPVVAIGTGEEQKYFIHLAKELGFFVIGFDQNPRSSASSLCDIFYPVSTENSQKIIGLLKEHKPLCVIPSPIGRHLTTVGLINDYFNIQSFGFQATTTLTDKQNFFSFMLSLGLNSPNTCRFSNLENLFSVATHLVYPVIIKPVSGSGSRGVLLADSWQTLLKYRDYLQSYETLFYEGVLVQEYINGIELGVDGLCLSGSLVDLNVRYKFLTLPPFRVEYAYFSPFAINENDKRLLFGMFQQIVDALQIKSCVFHADLVLTSKQEFFIIEMSTRPSGMSLSSCLLPKYLKKNYVKEFMVFMAGKSERNYYFPDKISSHGFLLEYFYSPQLDGKTVLIPSKQEVQQLKYIQEVSLPYSGLVEFMPAKVVADIIDRGYVIFRTSLEEVPRRRMCLYRLFKEA